jgi:hypothetical protein
MAQGKHPPGRPGLRPHIRLLRGSRRSRHYCSSPGPEDIWPPGEAGLTSKPHRDRSTRSRLTWAVSPAAGIGLPGRLRLGATTDPGGCHVRNANPLRLECQVGTPRKTTDSHRGTGFRPTAARGHREPVHRGVLCHSRRATCSTVVGGSRLFAHCGGCVAGRVHRPSPHLPGFAGNPLLAVAVSGHITGDSALGVSPSAGSILMPRSPLWPLFHRLWTGLVFRAGTGQAQQT